MLSAPTQPPARSWGVRHRDRTNPRKVAPSGTPPCRPRTARASITRSATVDHKPTRGTASELVASRNRVLRELPGWPLGAPGLRGEGRPHGVLSGRCLGDKVSMGGAAPLVSFSCYNCGKCRACDEYYRHRAEADVRNLARRRGLDIACMAHEQIVEAIW